MFNLEVQIVSEEGNPSEGIPAKQFIQYSIPKLGIEKKIVDYRLYPRVHANGESSIKFGDNHVKPDWEMDARFRKVSEKKYESSLLQLLLDMVFVPTFLLSSPEKRVALEYESLVTLAQDAVNAYASMITIPAPTRKKLFRFLFGDSEKDIEAQEKAKSQKDEISAFVVSFVADYLQKVGIFSRNPGGYSKDIEPWDCIVPVL